MDTNNVAGLNERITLIQGLDPLRVVAQFVATTPNGDPGRIGELRLSARDADGFQQGATNPLIKAWKYNNNYENISQVIGGSRMVAYNATPRFGMVQINDNGVSNEFYIENLGIDKPYKINANNGISFGAMSLPNVVKSETSRLNIQKSDGSYSFYIDYTSAFFPILGSTTGELGLAVSLIPTSGTLTIGSGGNRLSKLFSNNANIAGLAVRADNAAARAAGLIVGEFYRTATGQVMVAF